MFSGHGCALAQASNHSHHAAGEQPRQKNRSSWGLRDFQHRFGRTPRACGFETAVDLETLICSRTLGIAFTILAPRQASRVRRLGSRSWKDVSGDRIDPTRPYLLLATLPAQDRTFFYDGPISRAVAFEGLLDSGEQFAQRLLSGFSDQRDWPQLVNIATDGESYGTPPPLWRDGASYALEHIESNALAKITNYAEFLEQNPPTHQVEIFENSSWSCVHGTERWRSNCGCTRGHGEWNQNWRAPLRSALDWLRDTLASRYEERARSFLKDPWAARDEYVQVVLDRASRKHGAIPWGQYPARPLGCGQNHCLKLLELRGTPC